MAPLRILIVGAGIGGLTLGVALRRAGFDVAVAERAHDLKPVGAGLTVQINALAALDAIGLGERIHAAGHPIAEGLFADAAGRVLSRASLAPLKAEFGRLPVALHRATLHGLLHEAFGDDGLHLGAGAVSFAQDAEGVTLTLEDGRTLRGDVLVGADGLRSAVRRQLRGDEPLRYAGYTSWRGVCDAAGRDVLPGEYWGAGQRFGCTPIDGDRLYWFATANAPAGEHDGAHPRAELLRRFEGWAPQVRGLIEGTPEAAILRTDIFDRPPITSWSDGRVTLLGDAAHPMTPNLGQGACQAIEDAVALAEALRAHADPGAAFAAYEARRVARSRGYVERSWRIGAVGQWSHPLAVALRNTALRWTPPASLVRQLRAANQPA